MCCGARQQAGQGLQIVLTVGVDLHRVGEAGLHRPAEAFDHRGTLALVDLEAMDMNAVRRIVQGSDGGSGGRFAAVIDDEHRQVGAP